MVRWWCVVALVLGYGGSVGAQPRDEAPPEGPVEEGPVEGPLEEGPVEGEASGDDLEDGEPGEEPEERVIVVTGTRFEKTLDDTPVRTQVVDREAIEVRNARSLADVMKHTSGVRLETNCQNCGFTQLRLNGLDGVYTQILIDGLPIYSGLAGVYGLEQIPTEMIERVEVVKGGGSALYGPSAVAGVVNVITRRPSRPFSHLHVAHEALPGGATGLRINADAAIMNEAQTAGMFLFASSYRRDELDLNHDGFTELVRLRQVAGGASGYWSPVEGVDVEARFHAIQEYRRGGDRLDSPPHDADIAEELQTERLQGELRLKHRVGPQLDYQLAYAVSHTDRRSYYGGGGLNNPTLPDDPSDPEAYQAFVDAWEAKQAALGGYGRTLNPAHTGDLNVNTYFGVERPMVLTLGGQVQVDDVDDRYLGYERRIDEAYTIAGAYLQHDWLFADWGESLIGARIDKHSELDDPILSPRAALMLTPTDQLRLRSSAAAGFRAPQPFNEDLHIDLVGGSAQIIENDPGLKPERSWSFAQQVEFTAAPAPRWSLRVGLNGYLTFITDAFVLNERDDLATPEEEVIRENRATTRVIGAELEASVTYGRVWSLRAGWTLENTENGDPDEDFGETRIFRTPNNYGYAETTVALVDGLLRLQSGLDVTGPMRVSRFDGDGDPLTVIDSPWFFDWSINVSGTVDLDDGVFVEPFIGVQNLLDSRQTDFDTGPDRDASYIYGPPLPRTALVGVGAGF